MARVRTDPDATFDKLFATMPSPVAKAMLNYFVDAIVKSDALNPRSWCVYALPDRIRLLMGNLVVATINRDAVWVCLDGAALDAIPELKERLDVAEGFEWDLAGYPEYQPVPSRNAKLGFELATFATIEDVKRLHHAFLRSVARKYKALSARSVPSHDPRVLRTIERRLGLSDALPDPEFNLQTDWKREAVHDEQLLTSRIAGTQRDAIVLSRRGQGAFRTGVKRRWRNRCAVTGCGHVSLLIASHIKPWRVATDEERLDSANGLLLVPNVDALFDAGLVTFDDQGDIVVSSDVSAADLRALGIGSDERLVATDDAVREYLRFHRENVFNGSRFGPV